MTSEQIQKDLKLLREADSILQRHRIGEPAKDGDLFAYPTFVLLQELLTYLGELSARALDDPLDAENLWTFAMFVCSNLWEVCERKPDLIRNFSPRKMVFPIQWPLLKGEQKQIFDMIKNLGVGTKAIYNLHRRKSFSPKTPVNNLVLSHMNSINQLQYNMRMEFNRQRLIADLHGERVPAIDDYIRKKIARIKNPWLKQVMSLETLCRANADDWAKAIWQTILREYSGKPETNPELRGIGKYRERHSEHIGQQKKATPRTAATNVRAAIKERIFKAVRTLAGPSSRIIPAR